MLAVEDIKKKIKKFISETYRLPEEDLDETANLFEGIIDSLGAAEVVMFLEKEFDVKLKNAHLFDKRFVYIQGMASVIFEITQARVNGKVNKKGN